MIIQTNPSQVNTGDISVSFEPAEANTQQFESTQIQEDTTQNIAAGAYQVLVYNTGLEEITVNGFKVEPNDRVPFESKYNQETNRLDYTPAIVVITPLGGSAFYTALRPSA